MNNLRFSNNTLSTGPTMVTQLDPAGGQKVVLEDCTKVMQERGRFKQLTAAEDCSPPNNAARYNEAICSVSSETSPTSLKFSLSQLWGRQRIFHTPSSVTRPMSRPISAPPQIAELNRCYPDISSRRPLIVTLPPSESSAGSSRRSSLCQQRAVSFATVATASTSAPASSSSASSCTLPQTPEESTYCNSTGSNLLVSSASLRQDALLEAQRRIVDGREELDHYNSMIQHHEYERAEAWKSRTALQQKRDNLAREIEVLEGALKNPASLTPAVAVGLNRPSIKRQNSLFSNTAGFLWSMSPPKGSQGAAPSWEPVSEACCLSALSTTLNMATLDESKLVLATSITNDPSPSLAISSPDPKAQSLPCLRCKLRSILLDKQTLLRELQTDMDQIQQRLSVMTSQIKHIQRTFVAPLERCLADDRDVWARLSTAD